MTVTVNTRPGTGALRPGIRVGSPVVKVYRLTNHGEADLSGVRVSDPDVPGALIRCAGELGRFGQLAALSSATCTAELPATPGTHTAWVVASGVVPSLDLRLRASERSGYGGVAGVLDLSENVRLISFTEAELHYVLANLGNRTVYGIQLVDPVLAPGPFDCGGRADVPDLAPGASVTCVVRVRRAPGSYTSAATATGSDRTDTLSPAGLSVPPPLLTARSSASFVLPALPPPPPPATAQLPPPLPRAAPPRRPAFGSGPPGAAGPPNGLAPGEPGGPGGPGGSGGPGGPGGSGAAAGPGAPGAFAAPAAPGAPAGAGVGAGGAAGSGAPAGPEAPAEPGAPAAPAAPAATGGAGAAPAAPPGPGAPPPAAEPPAPAAPVAPGAGAGGAAALPPGVAPAVPPAAVPPNAVPPRAVPPTPPKAARPPAQTASFLGRLQHHAKAHPALSMAALLLLFLLPAALAALLLGSRRP
ncbi:hypothetical protein ABR738_04105 [Streptomyces sp. Edi4]|uniref:hypothetical protein n=1 Tax=Streptomyces sp. Edi4 TaxID=3162527 RepID=UPI0033063DA6